MSSHCSWSTFQLSALHHSLYTAVLFTARLLFCIRTIVLFIFNYDYTTRDKIFYLSLKIWNRQVEQTARTQPQVRFNFLERTHDSFRPLYRRWVFRNLQYQLHRLGTDWTYLYLCLYFNIESLYLPNILLRNFSSTPYLLLISLTHSMCVQCIDMHGLVTWPF